MMKVKVNVKWKETSQEEIIQYVRDYIIRRIIIITLSRREH